MPFFLLSPVTQRQEHSHSGPIFQALFIKPWDCWFWWQSEWLGPSLVTRVTKEDRTSNGWNAGDELKIAGLAGLFLLLNLRVTSILSHHSHEWCLCHQTINVCLSTERQKLGLHKRVLNRKERGHHGLEQRWADTALPLCPGPVLHAHVPAARDWGRLGGSVPCFIAHESHSLGCFSSELAQFQTEICTLNKKLLYWTLGLALEGYSSCLFLSYKVTDPGISTVEKVIWDGMLLLPKCVSHGEQAACYQRSQAH